MSGPALIYAAKSSKDDRDSIAGQIRDCQALAAREGYEVIGEPYVDENQSAYRKSRGDDLARAIAHAERLVAEHGSCALLVQHSDRLARGDAVRAAHLVERALWARKSGVTLRSYQDDHTFGDLIHAVLMGERNHEDSHRKSHSVRDGLERRRERGKPVGTMPTGYRVVPELDERGQPQVDRNGKVVTQRVPDPEGVKLVTRFLVLLGSGMTPGDVARRFNDEKVPTVGSTPASSWSRRTIRDMAQNTAYVGKKNYPRIVSDEIFDRAQAQLRRTDPVGRQGQKGGRRGDLVDDAYVLRGVLFCGACLEPMYTTKSYRSLGRAYVCKAKREARGTCDAPPVSAEAVEGAALAHLRDFRMDVDGWLKERVAEQSGQRAVLERQVAGLRRDAVRVERLIGRARRLMDGAEDDVVATAALREIARYEAEREEALARVADGESRVAEFTPEPDAEAAQRYYDGIRDLIAGRMENAEGALEINAALRDLLAGAWAVDTGHGVRVDFVLRGEDGWPDDEPLPVGSPPKFVTVERAEDVRVPDLPGREPEPAPEREPVRAQTGRETYVCRPHAPGELRDALVGHRLVSAHRQGKSMWVETDGGPVLGLHLGMAGRIVIDDEAAGDYWSDGGRKHLPVWDRFTLRFADGGWLALRDKRRLGRAVLNPRLDRLGPDAAKITRDDFRARVGRGEGPLKARIMDQSVLAGVGNLLADEALWRAKLDPRRPGGGLDDEELDRLRREIRATTRRAIERGGVHTGDVIPHRRRDGVCPRCGADMARATIGGRTTYWCSREQNGA